MALFSAERFWGLFRGNGGSFRKVLFTIIPRNTNILLKGLFWWVNIYKIYVLLVSINVKIEAIIEIEDVTLTVALTSPDVNSIWSFIGEDELMFVPDTQCAAGSANSQPSPRPHTPATSTTRTCNHQQWRWAFLNYFDHQILCKSKPSLIIILSVTMSKGVNQTLVCVLCDFLALWIITIWLKA